MNIYVVNGRYKFTHYGKALSFARQIDGRIDVVKTFNPISYFLAFI